MDSRKLSATMIHGFAVNMKLVEHGFRAKNLFIEWGGIRGGLALNHANSQIVSDMDQAVKKPRAYAANAFVQSPGYMRMYCHKVHDQAMAPTTAAVSQPQQP